MLPTIMENTNLVRQILHFCKTFPFDIGIWRTDRNPVSSEYFLNVSRRKTALTITIPKSNSRSSCFQFKTDKSPNGTKCESNLSWLNWEVSSGKCWVSLFKGHGGIQKKMFAILNAVSARSTDGK